MQEGKALTADIPSGLVHHHERHPQLPCPVEILAPPGDHGERAAAGWPLRGAGQRRTGALPRREQHSRTTLQTCGCSVKRDVLTYLSLSSSIGALRSERTSFAPCLRGHTWTGGSIFCGGWRSVVSPCLYIIKHLHMTARKTKHFGRPNTADRASGPNNAADRAHQPQACPCHPRVHTTPCRCVTRTSSAAASPGVLAR